MTIGQAGLHGEVPGEADVIIVGAGGPMVIDTPRDIDLAEMAFVAAGTEAGYPVSHDFNGAQHTGAAWLR